MPISMSMLGKAVRPLADVERALRAGKVTTGLGREASREAEKGTSRVAEGATRRESRVNLNNGRAAGKGERFVRGAGHAAKHGGSAYLNAVDKHGWKTMAPLTVAGIGAGMYGAHKVHGAVRNATNPSVAGSPQQTGEQPEAGNSILGNLGNAVGGLAKSPAGLALLAGGGLMLLGHGGMLGNAMKMTAAIMVAGLLAQHSNQIMSGAKQVVGKSTSKDGSTPQAGAASVKHVTYNGQNTSPKHDKTAGAPGVGTGHQQYVEQTRNNMQKSAQYQNQMTKQAQNGKSQQLDTDGPEVNA